MAAYNLKARVGKLQELEARGVIKPEHQQELDKYRQQGMVSGNNPGGRVKPTAEDTKLLTKSSADAASERDAQRLYAATGQAVDRLDTGPMQSWWMDAITPEEDGGFWDGVGGVLGSVARPFYSQQDWADRDHLKTVNAKVALEGSGQMKGSSSDKDTALMRLGGVGPGKSRTENRRIIRDATYQSGLSQTRALITSQWIGKYGSVTNPSANGMTYEEALQRGEQSYNRRQAARQAQRSLPKPPPKRQAPARQVTIDMNGNPIK